MLPSWLRQVKKRFVGQSKVSPIRQRLSVESLEERAVPATAVWAGTDVPDTTDANGNVIPGNLRWSDKNNWVSQFVPGNNDDVIFPAITPPVSNVQAPVNSAMDLNITISTLTILNSDYFISGKAPTGGGGGGGGGGGTPATLTITGAITANYASGSSTLTFKTLFTGNAQNIFVSNGALLDMEGPIGNGFLSGTQVPTVGVLKLGAGALTLGGSNTFTGLVVVDQGTLTATNNNSLGDKTQGTIVHDGATLAVGAMSLGESIEIVGTGDGGIGALYGLSGQISGGITLNPSASVGVIGGGSLTLSGGISGNGDLTKIGAGTLALKSANTYLGQTHIVAGTVQVQNDAALSPVDATLATGTVVESGATLQLVGNRTINNTENLYLNGSGVTDSLGNPIGALHAVNTGTSASTAEWKGNIFLKSASSIGAVDVSTLILSGPLADDVTSPLASLTKLGQGVAVFPNANPGFAGNMVINNGIVVMPGADVLGPAATTGAGNLFTSGAIIVNSISGIAGTLRVEGQFTSNKQLVLNGAGYNSAGALKVYDNPTDGIPTNVVWAGGIVVGSTTSIAVDAGTSLQVTGLIVDFTPGTSSGSIERNGTGTLTLSSNNTFLGALTLREGTTVVGAQQALGGVGGSGTAVSSGAILQMLDNQTINGEGLTLSGNSTLLAGNGNSAWTGIVNLVGSGGLTDVSVPASSILNFSNGLNGDADLHKIGAGELQLTGAIANTNTGTIRIDAGTVSLKKTGGAKATSGGFVVGDGLGGNNVDVLRLDAADQIPEGLVNPVRVNSSGLFNMNGFNETVGPLTLQGGEVNTGVGTLTLTSDVTVPGGTDNSKINGSLFLGGATRAFSLRPGAATSLGSSLNAALAGVTVTFTFTAAGSSAGDPTPGGSVDFFDGLTKINTSPRNLVGGVATVSTNALTVGSHTITAVYSGDPFYSSSTTTLAPAQVIANAAEKAVLSSNADPALPGQNVTFTYSLTGPTTAPLPTGTVSFFDGATPIGSAQTLTGGLAKVSTTTLSVGTHTITAVYTGDTIYSPSSAVLPNQVVGTPVALQLTTNSDPSAGGGSVTFTFSAAGDTLAPVPGGTVKFFDTFGGVTTQIGATKTLGVGSPAGTAFVTTSTLAAGTHSITAVYSGDPANGYLGGTIALAQNQEVSNVPLMNLSSNRNVFVIGDTTPLLTFSFNAYPNVAGGTAPSGTVTFFASGTQVGAAQTLVGGAALVDGSALSAGTYVITAVYAPDAASTYRGGTVTLTPNQVVVAAPTAAAILIASSRDPAPSGANVTFTFTGRGGSVPATGFVVFFDNGTAITPGGPGSQFRNINGAGVASVTTNSLSVGSHTITAVYLGDANYTGGTYTLVGGQEIVNPLLMQLTSDADPVASGATVTFTFTTTVATGANVPTGDVTFYDGSTQIGDIQTLDAAGKATLITSSLGVGSHTITAVYSGDTDYVGGTATLPVNQNVGNPPTMQLTANNAQVALNTAATFTFTASGVTGTPVPTGDVSFFDGATLIGVQTLDANGKATATTSNLSAGTHTITAVYSGDLNYAGGTTTLAPNQLVIDPLSVLLTTNAEPATPGQNVTFTYTAAKTLGSDPTPTGTVQFFDGNTAINPTSGGGTSVRPLSATGTASVTTNALSTGSHTIRAVYTPNAASQYPANSVTLVLPQVVGNPPYSPPLSPPVISTPGLNPVLEVNGVISGAAGAGITKTGAGQMYLNGVNTYTGPTTVNGSSGSLILGVQNSLPNNTAMTITAGTLDVNGKTTTVASLTGAASASPGILALNGGTFTVGTSNAPTTYSGAVTGPGTLIKVGTGTLLLNGASSSLTGTTTFNITAGAVFVSANFGAVAVTVQSGATLGGSGGTVGAVTVNAGGKLAPGTSPGILNSGSVSFATGSTFAVELNGTTAGSGYDRLAVTGTATLNDATLSLALGFVPAITSPLTAFTILTTTSGSSGTFKDVNGNRLNEGDSFVFGGRVFQITYAGGNVKLTVTAIAASSTLTSTLNPSQPGDNVKFTATFSPVAAGDPTPTGTVKFFDNGTQFGGTQNLSGGSAFVQTSTLTAGTHVITADYVSGNGYQNTTLTLTPAQGVNIITNTTLTTSAPRTVFTSAVTFTAQVTSASGPPNGSVTFFSSTTGNLGTVGLDGSGVARLTTSALAAGTGTITAVYNGTINFRVSSAALTEVVAHKPLVAATSGSGVVTVADPLTGGVIGAGSPFGFYPGGIKAAIGDVDGDGYSDLIIVAGPGAENGHVVIFSGRDFGLLGNYIAFPGYQGEFNVAAGDVNGDGLADVILGTASGADAVIVFSGASHTPLMIFSAFAAYGGFGGGITVAAGDIDGNGKDDIIVGTATVFSVAASFMNGSTDIAQLYGLPPVVLGLPVNGVSVAAGDVNGDGKADVILGTLTGQTLVAVFDGPSAGLVGGFFAYPGQPYGVRVSTADRNGDGKADIVTSFVTSSTAAVVYYSGLTFSLLDVFPGPIPGVTGIYVGGTSS